MLWALVGIVVNQYDASPVTTAAAAAATVPVVLEHFGALRGGRSRCGGESAVRRGYLKMRYRHTEGCAPPEGPKG